MAEWSTVGAWAPSGSSAKRMRLRFIWNAPANPGGATSIDVTLRVYVEVGYRVNWRNATLSVSGDMGSGAPGVDVVVANGGSKLIWQNTKTFPLQNGAYNVYARMALSGVGYVGATAYHNDSFRIPSASEALPQAPAWVRAERLSGEGRRFRVTWSPVSGATRYRVGEYRWSDKAFSWLADTAGTEYVAAGYEDEGYYYRVFAFNDAGDGPTRDSETVFTTPAQPSVNWDRVGAKIRLRVTNNAKFGKEYVVYWRTRDNQTWQKLTDWEAGAFGVVETITHEPPATAVVQYRVQAVVTQPSLANSVPADTEWIPVITPPLPPTLIRPSVAWPSDEPVQWSLTYNPVDGSDATATEIQYGIRGSDEKSWTTLAFNGWANPLGPTQLDRGSYVWRARNKGAHADWGKWSDVKGFYVTPRPTVTLTAPAPTSEYRSNRVTPDWSYDDSQSGFSTSPMYWEMTLYDSGLNSLELLYGNGEYQPTAFKTRLENHKTYTVQVVAWSSSSLTSLPQTVELTTDFLQPAQPLVRVEWDEPAGQVIVYGQETQRTAQLPNAAKLRFEKSYDGGLTWRLMREFDAPIDLSEVSVTDRFPPLNTDVSYRVTAISDLPTESDPVVVGVLTKTRRLWATPDVGPAVYAELDLSMDGTVEQEMETVTYEGDTYPTAHYGVGRKETVSVSAVLTAHYGSSPEQWRQIEGQSFLYRDPAGRRFRAALTASGLGMKPMRGERGKWTISGAVTRLNERIVED